VSLRFGTAVKVAASKSGRHVWVGYAIRILQVVFNEGSDLM
jgi:hypothetical protein